MGVLHGNRDRVEPPGPNLAKSRDPLADPIPALLAICAGNSPVTGEFPAQRPVTRSFDVFFDLRLNKQLSKQRWGWWFETPSRPLWRHCNGIARTRHADSVHTCNKISYPSQTDACNRDARAHLELVCRRHFEVWKLLDFYSNFNEIYSHARVQLTVSQTVIWTQDDVIKWKQFPRYWPFVRRIHRSPVNSPHKGQWLGALMFSRSAPEQTVE